MNLPLKRISELNLTSTLADEDLLILNKGINSTKTITLKTLRDSLNNSRLYINQDPPTTQEIDNVWIKPTDKEFYYYTGSEGWSLLFKDQSETSLLEHKDVLQDTPTNGSTLIWDSSINKWKVVVLSLMERTVYDTNNTGIVDNSERLGNQLPTYFLDRANHIGQINVDSLTTSSGNQGDYLKWNGAFWSAQPINLQTILDINPTTPDIGKAIIWSSTGFVLEQPRHLLYSNSSLLPTRSKINFRGDGISISDDPINGWTDLLITGVSNNTGIQKVEIASNGSLIGTRKRLNFIAGTATVFNISDNNVNDRVDITINNTAAGEFNTASNIGLGVGLYDQKVGSDLRFKTLVAGSNITLTSTANTVTISGIISGEVNTASNIGTGEQLFKQKVNSDLQFRSIKAGANVTLSTDSDSLTISSNYTPTTSLIVQDEGTTISTSAGTLNFIGSTVTATNNNGVIDLTFTEVASGEINTASNLGSGQGIYSTKVGTDLRFKTLVAGTGISLSSSTNAITINNTTVPLTIKDEGTTITNTPIELNFTGPGVTVTNSANLVTINVPSNNTTDSIIDYTSAILLTNENEQAELLLGRANVILNITSNRACRVRFYFNTSYRSSDLSRAIGVDPVGEHGLLLDVVTSNTNLSIDCSPLPVVAALASGSNSIPITITNLDTITGSVTITIRYLTL